jgi:hypothetical protein
MLAINNHVVLIEQHQAALMIVILMAFSSISGPASQGERRHVLPCSLRTGLVDRDSNSDPLSDEKSPSHV